MLLALMAMLALALYAPAALAQDDDGYDDDFDDGGGAAAPAQYDDDFDDDGVEDDADDDGYDDDSGVPLPSTGGPALLPIAGAALLIGASTVGIGAALKRRSRS